MMPQTLSGPMSITPEQVQQLERTLALLNAEIEMSEKELDTWRALGIAERTLYGWLAENLIDPGIKRRPLEKYTEAHKEYMAAKANLMILGIEKLKAERNIAQAMIQEAKQSVKAPGKNVRLA